jgi:uncharacterized alkaline shock family protein YloU
MRRAPVGGIMPVGKGKTRLALSGRKEHTMTERRTRGRQQQERAPLQTERGNTTISNAVVSQVAGIAAQEVEGVQMGGGTSRAVGGVLDNVRGGASGTTRGVTVEVGQEETAIDLSMAVEYGRSMPQISEAVRSNVIRRVENLVGLRVTEVNITVNDVLFPRLQE